ncbi:O-antigen ligase [Chryseobacterium defluvii]|uniref:O-antigen ligase n=1 Tax=Chryseobacterium defluvii TaxID=160396 RepID=A0A840KDX6_9FLAO|nr:O-antigen ligase family protein [Chryseobacterium defluvii]MBB4806177.1 O-antigen ligase [Chryseobacterium defluvii]
MEKTTHIKTLAPASPETFFLVLALFGYIISYFDPFSSERLSHTMNILIRGTVFFSALYFLVKNIDLVKKRKWMIITFLLFYGLYLLKAEYTFRNYTFLPDTLEKLKKTFYYYSLVIIPVPVISMISLDYGKVNFELFYKYVFWFLTIILGLNFLYSMFFMEFLKSGGGAFRAYYILVGHYGLSLVVMCVYSFFILKKWNISHGIALFLGLFPICISAARSPLLAFLAIALLLIILKNNRKYWIAFCLLVIMTVLLLFIAYTYGIGQDMIFLKRINAALFEGNASGRSYFFDKGLDEFFANPVLGGRILFESGMYSHNMFIDILMATGLVGMLLFIAYFQFVIRSFVKIARNIYKYKEAGILTLFFLQYFVLVQTSGNIYLSFEFWYFSGALIGLGYIKYNNEKIKSNDSRGNTAGDH